jgi:hypothetical protein
MKKVKRYLAARMLHVGCNAIDSIRVVQWSPVIMDAALTDKEQRLIRQRTEKVKEMVDDVRKIANHIERSAKT